MKYIKDLVLHSVLSFSLTERSSIMTVVINPKGNVEHLPTNFSGEVDSGRGSRPEKISDF